MGFKFSWLCTLLSSLDDNRVVKASTASKNTDPDNRVVARWFAQHDKRLRHKTTNPLAVLSCLLPERRTDRVYWLQERSLARVIGRSLLLGSSRREELDCWRARGGVDLGQCVENVMRQAENRVPDDQEVTLEEIDNALDRLASRCRFSGPQVRRQRAAVDVEEALGPLYRRLSSGDAKWLTRMILKNYSPVIVPGAFVLRSFHFLLPHLLHFQDSFDAALRVLSSEPMSNFPAHPEPGLARDLGVIAMQHLSPVTGVKVGRPDYYKARSIKHCCQIVGRRRMSLERKYDGEYCQIHVDLSRGANSVQIFSKSGKDSTIDRVGIHQVIRESLRIGERDCRFSRRCILEGELLVWSDKHWKIMDFHKLRKFISRSGMFIGTENDSPPQPYEHLMIVFFDILLLDDNVCLRKPHRERRLLLKDAIHVIPGRADIAEQEILDFSRADSQYRLEMSFSKRISQRWEGYVLKDCDEPYFSVFSTRENGSLGRWIKLKKDYIPGLGDTVDLAIIGGQCESRDAAEMQGVRKLSWTHFLVGCLVNKDAVLQLRARPKFRVVDTISQHSMSRKTLQILNQFGEFSACNPDSGHGFDIEHGQANIPGVDALFKTPFVVEMMGSGFEKPSGTRYFTLRFPRVMKIHWDRSFEDAASFAELQLLAEAARSAPAEDMGDERDQWAKRLRMSDGSSEYIADRSQGEVSTTSSPFDEASSEAVNQVKYPIPRDRSTASGHGLHSRSDPTNQVEPRKETAITSADVISIHIDQAVASRSSSEASDERSVLTENENLSQRCVSLSESPSKHRNTDSNEVSANTSLPKSPEQNGIPTPPTLGLRTKKAPQTASRTAMAPVRRTPLQSPLTQIPVYLHPSCSPQLSTYPASTTPNLASAMKTTTDELSSFLEDLSSKADRKAPFKIADAHALNKGTTYGLVCLNSTKTALGTEILGIGKALDSLFKGSNAGLRLQARIFFLDASFLRLQTTPADRRFCLRSTWEAIARQYFCACLRWDSGRILVGFDKRELGVLAVADHHA